MNNEQPGLFCTLSDILTGETVIEKEIEKKKRRKGAKEEINHDFA